MHMFFFFKRKTSYEMRISDWSSDVCSSDPVLGGGFGGISAAIDLVRLAGDLVDVTIVDREPEFAMGLTKLWVATGVRRPEESMRPRERLSRHGVERKSGVEGTSV